MPRPKSLTTADLAAAALAVIDRDGLPALTMRAVAQQLGMATMALYRYVPDRQRLEILVADAILGSIDVSPPPRTDWRERLAILLDRARAAISAHPAAVPLALRHRQTSPATTRWIEAMLTVLTEAGFTGRDRVIAQRVVVDFLLGFLQNEHYAALAGAGTAAMAELSAAEYPLLVDTATQAREMSADDEFRGGTELLVLGLSARLRHRP
ncbi:TetR/AcrR family transcriptional regulator C-terminal domain-containing protein [Nocardia sp. CDC153]|uniref:TetR/AcrR family transcriptional regulator C-terminal domain-containing protein n=1 Tax=Nocardia sp. CDC153 TaxID=3112167 RepID=UPI002DBD8F21|nr:TetR/AcrR family transcriptional regulator C-terminal domain-containing protein [Nocardia sp. CDC153]MEC3953740.1 TetR/AcrR family transcriptional regulator C-terminal domain-containing protein [Nocardia sp. CDC153]